MTTETADAAAQSDDEALKRSGLVWPIWVLGLIGAIAGILFIFVR